MLDGRRLVALIPARGGSKGLPGKNIRPLLGKPLIGWTIECALASVYVDDVIVSTDDTKIAAISRSFGGEVPFLRPANLASDSATTFDTIIHAIDWMKNECRSCDIVVLLQPTSPLRLSSDIDGALERMLQMKAAAIVSVCAVEHHPWWSNQLPEDGSMADFLNPKLLNGNRQQLPRYYRLNGALYAADIDYLKEYTGFFGPRTTSYIMPQSRSIDIDSVLDFDFAEFLMLKGTGNNDVL